MTGQRIRGVSGFPIPCIDDNTQTKIAALVKESFSQKSESERLLEAAKRAVEIAIEQDEGRRCPGLTNHSFK